MLPRYADGSTGQRTSKPNGTRRRSESPSKGRRDKRRGISIIGCCIWTVLLLWMIVAGWFASTIMLRDKPADALLGPMIFGPESRLGVAWSDIAERVASFLESRHQVEGYEKAQKSLEAYHLERGDFVDLIRKSGAELKDAAAKLFQNVPNIGILNAAASITSKGAQAILAKMSSGKLQEPGLQLQEPGLQLGARKASDSSHGNPNPGEGGAVNGEANTREATFDERPEVEPEAPVQGGGGNGEAEGKAAETVNTQALDQRLRGILPSDTNKEHPRPWTPSKVAVVIMAYPHDTTQELQSTIQSLRALAQASQFDVYVSQDHVDHKMNTFIVKLQSTGTIRHIVHDTADPSKLHMRERTARHQRLAMDSVFARQEGYTHAIFLEDALEFAPDFFDFFASTAPLMDRDPSIWCISAWHQIGYSGMDWDKTQLMRTGHFSGIAWMARRELWLELQATWPQESWVEWMQQDSTSKGRSCIIPEVSRVVRHGNPVYSQEEAQFERFNSKVVLSTLPSDFMNFGDTTYLLKEQYDDKLMRMVKRTRIIDNPGRAEVPANSFGPFLLIYTVKYNSQGPQSEYPLVAHKYGLPYKPVGEYDGLTIIKTKGNVMLVVRSDSKWAQMRQEEQGQQGQGELKPPEVS